MIDRTTLDLRIADHSTTTARVNQSAWRHNQPARRPIRIALASVLVSLAARLAPVPTAAGPRNQANQERPAAA